MKFNKWEVALLCDIYGALLSEKQRKALEMYCDEDYSLSEIAENTGISRQGVRDQIKHAQDLLVEYEQALELLEKRKKAEELLNRLKEMPAVSQNTDCTNTLDALKDLLGIDVE